MKKVKKALITLIDENNVAIRTSVMEGKDFFITVDPEMCKILVEALDISGKGKKPVVISNERLQELLEIEKEYKKAKKYVDPYEYAKLKCRYMLENAIKMTGGTPIDWACYNITQFLHDYLKEHNVKDSDSITEKRMQTVAFAHCLEDKLLDYIDKLEEFNS